MKNNNIILNNVLSTICSNYDGIDLNLESIIDIYKDERDLDNFSKRMGSLFHNFFNHAEISKILRNNVLTSQNNDASLSLIQDYLFTMSESKKKAFLENITNDFIHYYNTHKDITKIDVEILSSCLKPSNNKKEVSLLSQPEDVRIINRLTKRLFDDGPINKEGFLSNKKPKDNNVSISQIVPNIANIQSNKSAFSIPISNRTILSNSNSNTTHASSYVHQDLCINIIKEKINNIPPEQDFYYNLESIKNLLAQNSELRQNKEIKEIRDILNGIVRPWISFDNQTKLKISELESDILFFAKESIKYYIDSIETKTKRISNITCTLLSKCENRKSIIRNYFSANAPGETVQNVNFPSSLNIFSEHNFIPQYDTIEEEVLVLGPSDILHDMEFSKKEKEKKENKKNGWDIGK